MPRFSVLVAVMAAVLLLLMAPSGRAQPPSHAVAGIIDLRGWDFSSHGPAELAGEWRLDEERLRVLPGPWNSGPAPIPAQGRHTLSLTLLLPDNAAPLALSVPDINSAFTLRINGAESTAAGRPGDSRDEEVPVIARKMVPLPAGAQRVDLSLDVSNFRHFEGGVVRAIRVGLAADLRAEQVRFQALPLVVFGALVMVLLVLAAFWLGGKRDPNFLVCAVFTALVAWRTTSTGELYTLFGDDLRSDVWHFPAAYAAMYAFPGIYIAMLRGLFPREVRRWIAWPLYALSAVPLLMMLVTGPEIYTRGRDLFSVLALPLQAIVNLLLVQALLRRRFGAGWLLAGSLLASATVANDALHYLRVIQSTDLSSLGFAIFSLSYFAALALRLFRSEQVASERLAALNRALEDKVLARTASLEKAKAEAEQASLAKSEFLAVMSHEIRTPLHGWAGLTQLLEGTGLNERQSHYVGLLRRTAEHLTRLIGDILDMSRIEAGRMELAVEPIALAAFIDELVALGRAQAADKGLDFVAEVAEGLPAAVSGDSGAIRQIVLNFLGNAAKFTRHGHIALSVDTGERGVRFTVSDTGCGIPRDRLGDIFETFTQVDNSIRRRHGGSGLGLAICRRLAELMGGAVGASSQLGAGTSVWCDLPLPGCEVWPHDDAAAPAPVLRSGVRVLVADDVELNRLVLREFLTGTGALVDEAADGLEVLTKIEVGHYDIAVLDLRMPGLDGFETARAIRRREAERSLAPLPLAALSAGAATADRQAAADAGFTAFLAKPIDRPALLAALAALLPKGMTMADISPPDIPQGLEHLLPQFIAEMEKDVVRLGDLAGGELAELAEFAHAMRGKAAMFGEQPLFELLTRIEELALRNRNDELPTLITQVVERVGQLQVYGSIAVQGPP
jgi:signal transduction histidine kinase/DNA-binding response OmpR family regulator